MTFGDVQNVANRSVADMLSPKDFAAIANFAYQAFGLHLPPNKREMVFARLIKRLRFTGIETFGQYLAFVKEPKNTQERSAFLSALTTNVTQFFREAHHFEYLRSDIFPDLIARAKTGQRVRIWSAGCSEGQEAYSIALLLYEMCPEALKYDIKILASDIDPQVLTRANSGSYPIAELSNIPQQYHCFTQPSQTDSGMFDIAKGPRGLITFAELNLIADWPMRGPFNVIFCRNVAIYFDAATQSILWRRFAELLAEQGVLLIGHSERVIGPAADVLTNVGITAYAKKISSKPA